MRPKSTKQIKKVDTFPKSEAFYNLVVKTICRNDESLTNCAFVHPVNLTQVSPRSCLDFAVILFVHCATGA